MGSLEPLVTYKCLTKANKCKWYLQIERNIVVLRMGNWKQVSKQAKYLLNKFAVVLHMVFLCLREASDLPYMDLDWSDCLVIDDLTSYNTSAAVLQTNPM